MPLCSSRYYGYVLDPCPRYGSMSTVRSEHVDLSSTTTFKRSYVLTCILAVVRSIYSLYITEFENKMIYSLLAVVLILLLIGLWLRLECSLDSLSIDSAHVIYVSEGYDVAYNRRTASQPSYVVLRVTWYVKTFRNVNYVC